MTRSKFNVCGFIMERGERGVVGDYWSATGWIRGRLYLKSGIFNGYPRRDVAGILKAKMRADYAAHALRRKLEEAR